MNMKDFFEELNEIERNRTFKDFYNESIKTDVLVLYALMINRVEDNIEKIRVCKFKNEDDYFDVNISELIKYIKSNKIILWCIDTKQGFDNLSLVYPALNEHGKEYLTTSCDLSATNNLENLPTF